MKWDSEAFKGSALSECDAIKNKVFAMSCGLRRDEEFEAVTIA